MLALAAAALAAAGAGERAGSTTAHVVGDRPKVLVATSGNHSETRKTIPITRRSKAERRVVMSMRPRRLPDLRPGDLLKLSAELEVTLDCHRRARSCAGRPYLYNARLGSQLVLGRGRNATGGRRAIAITARKKTTCRGKPLSSREHHCVIVFTRASLPVGERGTVPCNHLSCRVNLVLDAHSREARRGDKLVIGNNRPTGRIAQDHGRINAVRLRPGAQPSPPKRITRHRRRHSVPLNATPTVVVSKRLDGLRKNEQLAVLARFETDVSHLPYTARVSSQLILARRARSTRPSRKVRRVASLEGEIDEINGTNCTKIQTPCPYTKVGVLRMRRDARDSSGRPIALHVNLYVISNPKRARRRPGHRLRVLPHPKLEVVRYGPSLRG